MWNHEGEWIPIWRKHGAAGKNSEATDPESFDAVNQIRTHATTSRRDVEHPRCTRRRMRHRADDS